ncbi:MAG: LacI family transcriptional regulator [Dysgonamonadaceae bacterium]|jgi:LacI family transcriptional regulator|nr:LacI family transcriptional regulator [Dysgonamonadaceae bacterium]
MEGVSLKNIAKELGVSVATVSLVLNGKNGNGRVSKEMSRRILDKANELNYTPNSLAKGLKMGRSKTIGLIIADISNVFFGTLALHIQNYAQQRGYTVIIGNTNEKLSEMVKMVGLMKSRQVDGLIMTPAENSENLVLKLEKSGVPIVLVDRAFPYLKTNSVLINNYEISFRATQGLISRVGKNIALLTYKQDQFHTNERKRGCIDAMENVGIFNPDNVKEVKYESLKEDIDNAITELISKKDKIRGIFFATNSISILGVKSLYKHGMKIQEDIHIVCFDEHDTFDLLPFKVPYIKQPIRQMAEEATRLLIEQIEGGNTKKDTCFIEAELIES